MKEDIIRMAREAGYGDAMADLHGPALERFFRMAQAAEREACAKEAEAQKCHMVAHAIRARGQDPMPLFDDWPGGWKK